MPHKPTGPQHTIPLNAKAAEPLRQAAYTRLEQDIQRLETAILTTRRARNRKAWNAYMRLTRTASLLDRTGWTHHQREPVVLDAEHLAIARAALRHELDAESDTKATALAQGAHDAAQAATERALILYEALNALEADTAAATACGLQGRC